MKKIIVITGGGSGLGKAVALLLSKNHQVIILSRNTEELKKVSLEIGCEYFTCDVSNYLECEKVLAEIVEKYGRVDVLINNAGLWIEGRLEENDLEKIESVVNVNILGVIYMTRIIIPIMKKQGSGLIINTNSQGGIYAKAERSIYTATKWAITGFAKALQPEIAKDNIRITNIHPGKMNTDFFKGCPPKPTFDGLSAEEVAKAYEFVINQPENIEIPELGIKHPLG